MLCVDEVNVVSWVDYVEVRLFFLFDDDLLVLGCIGCCWLVMFLFTYNNDFIISYFGYDFILDLPLIIYSFNKCLN